jgi:hypothetical protein
VTKEKLISALEQTNSEVIRNKAAQIGLQIQAENGIEKAISVIEEHADLFSRRT